MDCLRVGLPPSGHSLWPPFTHLALHVNPWPSLFSGLPDVRVLLLSAPQCSVLGVSSFSCGFPPITCLCSSHSLPCCCTSPNRHFHCPLCQFLFPFLRDPASSPISRAAATSHYSPIARFPVCCCMQDAISRISYARTILDVF